MPWLKKGKNTIAAEVFNFGEHRPAAMYSRQTAFIVQGEGPVAGQLDTPGNWKVMQNEAYSPIPVSSAMTGGYYVAGPTDHFNAILHSWGWKENSFNDSEWLTPRDLGKGVGRRYMHGVQWMLVPRNIPLLESKLIRFAGIARASAEEIQDDFLHGKGPLHIPANSHHYQ